MDIIAAFEAVVGGSSPSERTRINFELWPHVLYLSVLGSRGHCLMVGRVLAKDEVGVRFSLTAPSFGVFSGKAIQI